MERGDVRDLYERWVWILVGTSNLQGALSMYPPSNHLTFRERPIPYTGRRRHSVIFRSPKTYAELRALNGFLHDEERHEYKIRFRIKRKYIPTHWDDILVYSDKSWKRYRKTQWKPKS